MVSLALPVLFCLCVRIYGTCRGEAEEVFRGLAETMIASGRLPHVMRHNMHVSLNLSQKLGGRSHLGINLFVVFSGI